MPGVVLFAIFSGTNISGKMKMFQVYEIPQHLADLSLQGIHTLVWLVVTPFLCSDLTVFTLLDAQGAFRSSTTRTRASATPPTTWPTSSAPHRVRIHTPNRLTKTRERGQHSHQPDSKQVFRLRESIGHMELCSCRLPFSSLFLAFCSFSH